MVSNTTRLDRIIDVLAEIYDVRIPILLVVFRSRHISIPRQLRASVDSRINIAMHCLNEPEVFDITCASTQ